MGWILDQFDGIQARLHAALAAPAQTSAGFGASSSTSWLDHVVLPRPPKINDNVSEVHNPSGRPSIEMVFFHGLQLEGSTEAYLTTWSSRDGSELWLRWLLKDFPDARILVISYDAHARKTDKQGHMDMYSTRENLVHNLLDAKVGQHRCPVVFVGHCLGGLVMKEVCVQANSTLSLNPSAQYKIGLQNLLETVRGLFFYASPHHGSVLADSSTWFSKGSLFRDVRTLNKEGERRNEDFRKLRTKCDWSTFGVGESFPITVGNFSDLLVTEASARHDVDVFYKVDADHFNVCKPHAPNSSSYKLLSQFMSSLSYEEVVNEHDCHGLPDYPIKLKARGDDVEKLLMENAVVGISGMGGIGKTTLAKKVYNNIYTQFDYACFAENVKGVEIRDLEDWLLRRFHGLGRRIDESRRQWSNFKGKKTLIVMDDVDSENQLSILPKLHHFGKDSCIILTSRDQGIFKFYDNSGIHEVGLLQENAAKKLFCQHAFGTKKIPDHAIERNVKAVVKKCNGLPLTLEVIGRYLRDETDSKVWEETIVRLTKAQSIGGELNDRVWASLRVSFDSLAKEEQDMFIEAATFFFEKDLDYALAAWSSTNESSVTMWKNLVRRSMVKERKSRKVWVHEQLRDLASSISNGDILTGSNEKANILVDQVNSNEVNGTTTILEIRSPHLDRTLQLHCVDELTKLKYVDLDLVQHEGTGKKFPRTLALLTWSGRHNNKSNLAVSLRHANYIAVLKLRNWGVPKGFPETVGSLTNLCYLSLDGLKGLDRLPEDFGNLSRLKHLVLSDVRLSRLPESFGNLSALENLHLKDLDVVEFPESFGNLSSLVKLRITSCKFLERLPLSFSELCQLHQLCLSYCSRLNELGDSFGNLSVLEELDVIWTGIERLPDSFIQLSRLRRLKLRYCTSLKELGDSFGNLSALQYLSLEHTKIERLPTSIGRLSALEKLDCRVSQARQLPDNFCLLTSLRDLSIVSPTLESLPEGLGDLVRLKTLCLEVDGVMTLPIAFGKLSSLQTLNIRSKKLEKLPDSFANLSSLQKLTIKVKSLVSVIPIIGAVSSLRTLKILEFENLSQHNLDCQDTGGKFPEDSFARLSSLQELKIKEKSLESLPTSVGDLSSLRTMSIECGNVRKLPYSLGNLSSLNTLRIVTSKLERLPESIGLLRSLRDLTVRVPSIRRLPDSLQQLSSLQSFSFDCYGHERLPDHFDHLSFASLSLRLHGRGHLPEGIDRLSSLQDLELEFGNLESLPELGNYLSSVRKLKMKCRSLLGIPDSLGRLSLLEELHLVGCYDLKSLPDTLGRLSSLKELHVSYCDGLKSLPETLGRLSSLKELHVSYCDGLKSVPRSLGRTSSHHLALPHGERRTDQGPSLQTTAVGANTTELTIYVGNCPLLDDSRMKRWNRDSSPNKREAHSPSFERGKFNELVFQYPIRIPERFALVIRSLLTQEGIGLTLSPDFKFLEVAYPYVAKRLLTDPDPALRERLLQVLFKDGYFQWKRLENLIVLAREQVSMMNRNSPLQETLAANRRLTDNSQKSKTFVGGKLDLTDTIKDGARVVTSGASLRRQLLLAFTEGNNLHIQEVLDIYRLVEGEFNPTTVATDLLRSLPTAARDFALSWSDSILAET